MSKLRQKRLSKVGSKQRQVVSKNLLFRLIFNPLVFIGRALVFIVAKVIIPIIQATTDQSSIVSVDKVSQIKIFDHFIVVNINVHKTPDNR